MRSTPAAAMALLLACGPPVPKDSPERAAPVVTPAPTAPPTCDARDDLGGLAWVPADVRLAVVLDLASPELPAALARLHEGVQAGRGLPVVAGLGLAQLDLQLAILRPQLLAAGLQPRELALLHDRDGAVVWVLRARCDLADLQAALASRWSLVVRTLTGGSVAEAPRGAAAARVAFEVAFLSDDRLALTPPGAAAPLRRWLEARPDAPVTPGPAGPAPAEVLAEIAPAPIRGVLAGRALQADGAADTPLVRTLRATATALEVDGTP